MILLPRGRNFCCCCCGCGFVEQKKPGAAIRPFSTLGRFRIPRAQGPVECKIGIHRGSSSPSFVQFVSPSSLPRIPKIPRRGSGAARSSSGRSFAPGIPLLCSPFLGNSVLVAEELRNPLGSPPAQRINTVDTTVIIFI